MAWGAVIGGGIALIGGIASASSSASASNKAAKSMENMMQIKTAPSGRKYVALSVLSPALCDLMDRYEITGYRSDYRDEPCYIDTLIWVYKNPEYQSFVADAAQLVVEAVAEIAAREAYHTAAEERQRDEERRQCRLDDAWIAAHPGGVRIYFSSWGSGFDEPLYVIQKSRREDVIQTVADGICRKNRMVRGGRVRSDGTSMHRGRPSAHHYAFSMGTPELGGGFNICAEVWFSIEDINI